MLIRSEFIEQNRERWHDVKKEQKIYTDQAQVFCYFYSGRSPNVISTAI
jgi:hypothetical protein